MAPEEYLKRNLGSGGDVVVVAAAAALRVVGADAGVVGRHASLQPHPARPRPVRLHHRHRADRAGVRVLPAAGGGQHPVRRRRRGGHPAGLRHAGRRRGSLLPSVEDWFGARRELRTIQPLLDGARSTPSRRRHRRTPPRPAGVPGRRADVADLRRAVPGGHRRRRRAEATGRRHRRTTDARARRGGRRVRTRVTAGAAAGAGADDRAVDLRRPRGRAEGHERCVPGTWLAAPAHVVFGSRMDPRDRAAISPAGALQEWDAAS